MSNKKQQPYSPFGRALKELREKSNKTQSEVSGAVEIGSDTLASYEVGETRPSEDVLYLLLQHFGVSGIQAQEMWRLAGYVGMAPEDSQYFINDEYGGVKEVREVMVSEEDSRIIYTDMIQVMVNKYGVIMNFMQGAGSNNKPLAVSRIGMSKEHAKSIIEVLKTTLEKADEVSSKMDQPKQLPRGKRKEQ